MKAAKPGTKDARSGDVDEETFFARLLNPKGRSTRSQYILAFLAAVGSFLLAFIILAGTGTMYVYADLLIPLGAVVYVLVVFAHIRRLHDLGRSGWLVLVFLVPFVNFIVFLHLLTSPAPEDLQKHRSEMTNIIEQVKKGQ